LIFLQPFGLILRRILKHFQNTIRNTHAMKATLERIEPVFGNSFTIRKFTDINYLGKPYWHFHPEYEIVYISNGRGKRHIGEHVSFYEQGDLIF